MSYLLRIALILLLTGCQISASTSYDTIIRGGTIYNGLGGEPFIADVAFEADKISAIGDLSKFSATEEIDATGLAVAPGFINMLSWAPVALLVDGKSQSDIRQGVTLEVFGEGQSMGPLSEQMKNDEAESQGDLKYDVGWTTLGEYLDHAVARGVSPNIASFVGATTVRIHELGYEDRAPTEAEMDRMRGLVRQAMEEGALGLGSSLIYAPAFYADTNELIELSKVVAEYNGLYISHMRSEGNRLIESVEELLTIAREADVRAEIYHLKAAGKANWSKLDNVIEMVEQARSEGVEVTADIYPYTAGATGLDAAMPPWVQEGGYNAWADRLRDPDTRKKVALEMATPTDDWENLYLAAGSAENVLLVGFKSEALKPLTGKTLAEVSAMRGTSPEETAIDLVIEDGSRVESVYFLMSEENIRKKLKQPWVSIDSDAGSLASEGVFLKSNPHPRAYGTFARVLGKYVREEQVISLAEAVRRLTALPAENLKIQKRGQLQVGYFADVTVFNPDTIIDHATFEQPHQYATGMQHVFVNGEQVLADGEHTGALPGRVVRGPGWTGHP